MEMLREADVDGVGGGDRRRRRPRQPHQQADGGAEQQQPDGGEQGDPARDCERLAGARRPSQ